MDRCLGLKGGIIHLCGIVSLVGNSPDYQAGDLVKICSVSHGTALHLNAHGIELFLDTVLDLFGRYELISGGNSSPEGLNVGIYLVAGFLRKVYKFSEPTGAWT